MKKILLLTIFCSFFIGLQNIFAQGATCGAAAILCDPMASFAATTGEPDEGGLPSCGTSTVSSTPNPAFYTFLVSESGDIDLTITNDQDFDVDFAIWGPYADFDAASASCGGVFPQDGAAIATPIDCGYSSGSTENLSVIGALAGEVYILLITNFSDADTQIALMSAGAGNTASLGGPLSIDAVTSVTTGDAAFALTTSPPASDPDVTLDASPWSGTGITDPVAGIFDPAVAGVGTHTITVMGTSLGCPVTVTRDIVVTAPPVACPMITSATADALGCAGETISLVATVDSGVENQDYIIEWYEDGVAISGSASSGPDGIPGSADDISTLSYTHTLPANTTCGSADIQYTAQIYCLGVDEILDLGDLSATGTTDDGTTPIGVYFNYTQPLTSYSLDLAGLPACAVATSFDYGYAIASGSPYGNSYICEAVVEITSPVGSSSPICEENVTGCAAYPSTAPGCGSTGNGAGSDAINPTEMQSFGGINSTTMASGIWEIGVWDFYDDEDADVEGQINGLYLKVSYLYPPGCDQNAAAGSIVNVTNLTTVCTAPAVGVDFTLPDNTACSSDITAVCTDGVVMYSNDNGTTYTSATPPVTPLDGETVYYEVSMTGCPTTCTTTGSYVLSGCCDIAYVSATPTDEACPGSNTGQLVVNATCTTCTTIEYSVNGSAFQASNTFTGLGAGSYSVAVRDSGDTGCNDASLSNVSIGSGTCDVSISDPCVCNDDADANGANGTFNEIVEVESGVIGQTWTVASINPGTTPTSTANALPAISAGAALSDNADGTYSIEFNHLDGQGYSIVVEGPNAAGDASNVELSISNSCTYPSASIIGSGFVCSTADPITLQGVPNTGAAIIWSGTGITDNNDGTAEFDPSGLAAGDYVVTYAYTGTAAAGTSAPGCLSTVTSTVSVQPCAPACSSVILDLSLQEDDVCDGQTIDLTLPITPDLLALVDAVANGGDGDGMVGEEGTTEGDNLLALFEFGINATPNTFSNNPYTAPPTVLGTPTDVFGVSGNSSISGFATFTHTGTTCAPEEYVVYAYLADAAFEANGGFIPDDCAPWVAEVITVYPDPANFGTRTVALGNCQLEVIPTFAGEDCPNYTVIPSIITATQTGGGTIAVQIHAPDDAVAGASCAAFTVDVDVDDVLAYDAAETYACSADADGNIIFISDDQVLDMTLGAIAGGSGTYTVCGGSGVYSDVSGTALVFDGSVSIASSDVINVHANQPWNLSICDENGCELEIAGLYSFPEGEIDVAGFACTTGNVMPIFYGAEDGNNLNASNFPNLTTVSLTEFGSATGALTDNGDGTASWNPAISGEGDFEILLEIVDGTTGCARSTFEEIRVETCSPACSSVILDLSLQQDDVCTGSTIDLSLPITPDMVALVEAAVSTGTDVNGEIDTAAEEVALIALFEFGVNADANDFAENPYTTGSLGVDIISLGTADDLFGPLDNPSVFLNATFTHSGADNCTPENYIVYAFLNTAQAATLGVEPSCQPWVAEAITVWPDPADQTVMISSTDGCTTTFTSSCPNMIVSPSSYVANDGDAATTVAVTLSIPGNECAASTTDVAVGACDIDCDVYDIHDLVAEETSLCTGETTDLTASVSDDLNGVNIYFGYYIGNIDNPYDAIGLGIVNDLGSDIADEIFGIGGANYAQLSTADLPANTTCAPIEYTVIAYLDRVTPDATTPQGVIDNNCAPIAFTTVTVWPDPANATVMIASTDGCTTTFTSSCPNMIVSPSSYVANNGDAATTVAVTLSIPGNECAASTTDVAVGACDIDCDVYDIHDLVAEETSLCTGETTDLTASVSDDLNGVNIYFGYYIGNIDNPYDAIGLGIVNDLGSDIADEFFGIGGANYAQLSTADLPANTTCAPIEYTVIAYLDRVTPDATTPQGVIDNNCAPIAFTTVTVWPDPANATVMIASTDGCTTTFTSSCPNMIVSPSSYVANNGDAATTVAVTLSIPGNECAASTTNIAVGACDPECEFPFELSIPENEVCDGQTMDLQIPLTSGAFDVLDLDNSGTLELNELALVQVGVLDLGGAFPSGIFDDFNPYELAGIGLINNTPASAIFTDASIVVQNFSIDLVDPTVVCGGSEFVVFAYFADAAYQANGGPIPDDCMPFAAEALTVYNDPNDLDVFTVLDGGNCEATLSVVDPISGLICTDYSLLITDAVSGDFICSGCNTIPLTGNDVNVFIIAPSAAENAFTGACIATTPILIDLPDALSASAIVNNNTSCHGTADGAATASSTGGTAPFTFAWSNGDATSAVTGLAAGGYTVTVTDANGCTATSSVNITEPTEVTVAVIAKGDVTCAGLADGSVTLFYSGGGSPAFTYMLFKIGSTINDLTFVDQNTIGDFIGLTAGNYTVQITDDNNAVIDCFDFINFEILEPQALVLETISTTDESCDGSNNGMATVNATGGTLLPVTTAGFVGDFSPANWTTTELPAAHDGSATGTTLNVVLVSSDDGSGASSVDYCHTFTEAANVSFAWTYTTNDGPFFDPLAYSLNGNLVPLSSTSFAPGTESGTVALSVAAGDELCFSQLSTDGLFGAATSTISNFTVADTEATYTYEWPTTPVQTGNVGTDLAPGTYTVTATDAAGCIATTDVVIGAGATLTISEIADLAPVCPEAGFPTILLDASPANAGIVYTWTVNDPDNVIDLVDNLTGVSRLNPAIPSFNATANEGVATITVTATLGSCTDTEVFTVTVEDAVSPIFLNCPGDIIIGNDPDECSAKVEWIIPVATDGCSGIAIPVTAAATNAYVSGDIIPVGTYTISYTANDGNGNMITCTFDIMVMDTQDPEFDADIVMPGDITVECDAVPEAFVLTNNDVHDNCTLPATLVIDYTEVRTDGNCANNYTLTRTWTITDEASNVTVHIQTITVQDTTNPIALCQDATVVLDEFGMGSIVFADIDNGSSDNCTADANLAFGLSQSNFDCNDVDPDGIEITLTVTDECGNEDTCTATVTVEEGDTPCTPTYDVNGSDPCVCMNNATTLDNGQFAEFIQFEAVAGDVVTVTSVTGLFLETSPAPPAAPIALPVGTPLLNGTADGVDNDGDGVIDEADENTFYTLSAIHIDGQGYEIQVTGGNFGLSDVLSNTCFYPTPEFIDLPTELCLGTVFPIVVEDAFGAVADNITITVNGNTVAGDIFDASTLGIGTHTISATFDAGEAGQFTLENGLPLGAITSLDDAQADPGCQFTITETVEVVETPSQLICNDLVNISLAADNCLNEVTPDMVLEGGYACFDDYNVVLNYPLGSNVHNPANQIDGSHVGSTMVYTLVHPISGNVCWGELLVEDKAAPIIECPEDVTITCAVDIDDLTQTGSPVVTDCSDFTVDYSDETILDNGACGDVDGILLVIERTFIAVDEYDNVSECMQIITVERSINSVEIPGDIAWSCEQYAANSNITDAEAFLFNYASLPDNTEFADIKDASGLTGNNLANTGSGYPNIGGVGVNNGSCMLSVSFEDDVYEVCGDGASFEILRTWKVRDMCAPLEPGVNPFESIQIIKVLDTNGPVIEMETEITVSANVNGEHPTPCTADFTIPSANIYDVCSSVASIETIHPFGTNEENGGTLSGLAIGDYIVTYVATDVCGNVTNRDLIIHVVDDILPTPVCDELTQVALNAVGTATVYAETFDDGSYDNCGLERLEVRRMEDNCGVSGNTTFGSSIDFCCSDIQFDADGNPVPVMVALRVFDYEGLSNDCMVEVIVEDKLNPYKVGDVADGLDIDCISFQNNLQGVLDVLYAEAGLSIGETMSGNPDTLITLYGDVSYEDNCSVSYNVSWSYTIDGCGNGTINRSWNNVLDASGNSAPSCSQTIEIFGTSDWSVSFPADDEVDCGDSDVPVFTTQDILDNRINSAGCELIAVSMDVERFTTVPGACYVDVYTWTVIDWCTYELGTEDIEGTTTDGIEIGYTEIRVIDNDAPMIDISNVQTFFCIGEDLDANTNDNDDEPCTLDISLTDAVVTDCVGEDNVTVTHSILSNGTTGLNHNNMELGDYTVEVTAIDACGNTSVMEYTITVADCKAPTPYCVGSLIVELMPIDNNGDGQPDAGMVELWASDFDVASQDNCTDVELLMTNNIPVTFNADGSVAIPSQADANWEFTCADLVPNAPGETGVGEGHLQTIQLYVVDAYDNVDVCETTLYLETVDNVCGDNVEGPDELNIAGAVATENNASVAGVTVELNNNSTATTSDANGMYNLNATTGSDVTVTPMYDVYDNSVTTYDLVIIRQHILTTSLLDSPYKVIAADINNSGTITGSDLVAAKQVILGMASGYPNNNAWTFVDADYTFAADWNLLTDGYPAVTSINNIAQDEIADFVAVRIGDVNGTYGFADDADERNSFIINANDAKLAAGQEFTVEFTSADYAALGYQFTLNFSNLEVVAVDGNTEDFGIFANAITTSFNGEKEGDKLFAVTFKATSNLTVSEALTLTSNITKAEAYNTNGAAMPVVLEFNNSNDNEFALYQNSPNPFAGRTVVGFSLPTASAATLTITDISGKVLSVVEGDYTKGYNEVSISNLDATGVLYYQLDTPTNSAVRKMVVID